MASGAKLQKYLPEVEAALDGHEKVVAAVESTIEDKNSQIQGMLSTGALALTEKRLIYRGGAGITKLKVSRDIPLSKISSVDLVTSNFLKSFRTAPMTIHHFGGVEEFFMTPADAESFVSKLRGLLEKTEPGTQKNDDISESLERLADLYSKGSISDQEYVAAKAKLLGL